MRHSSFTDYEPRMLIRVVSDPDRAFSMTELAEEFGISRNHLRKIMHRLARRVDRDAAWRRWRRLARDYGRGDPSRHDRPLSGGGAAADGVLCRGPGSDCTIGGHCRLKLRLRWAEATFIAGPLPA